MAKRKRRVSARKKAEIQYYKDLYEAFRAKKKLVGQSCIGLRHKEFTEELRRRLSEMYHSYSCQSYDLKWAIRIEGHQVVLEVYNGRCPAMGWLEHAPWPDMLESLGLIELLVSLEQETSYIQDIEDLIYT